jgi:hypothetical protein
MPIIGVVCSADYFPPDDPTILSRELNQRQALVVEIARRLPFDIVAHSTGLRLTEDTPEEGVRVLLRRSHTFDMNVSDVWFIVIFSEKAPDDEAQLEVRNTLEEVLEGYFFHRVHPASKWSLDIFWGQSRGCIVGLTPDLIRW